MNDIFYPKYYKEKCFRCGSFPLEIWAFVYKENNIEKSFPVLVCPTRGGCGNFFDIDEYDVCEEELRVKL